MIRFYNGRVLTVTGGMSVAEQEVWTDGDKIVYVGPEKAETPAFEREIDLKGDLLMPGFKNAHTHSAMTFLRSYADDLPLQTWLFDKVFPNEDKLTPEYVYWLTKLAVMEYLTSGITSSFDMYFFRPEYAAANIECGFRTVICNPSSGEQKDLDFVRADYEHFNSLHPLVSFKLGFHAEYTTPLDTLQKMSALSHELKAPVWTHNSETKSEVEGCIERYGLTPTALFDREGLLDYGGGGYHCVWLSEEDMEIFKRRNAWVVTNPGSNAKLASGIAPLCRMMEKGLNLAIGTDGPASNNALDMFREMYLACVLQKLRNMDAAACDPEAVLAMAVSGGARAMGLDDCDDIAVGKQADLIVIDLKRPNMQPVHSIPKNLVYSGSKENVRLTMIAGKILYEKGEFFIGEKPGTIYAQCDRIVRTITD